jgi:hypothetical protein
MQDAADELVTDMMRKYNKKESCNWFHANCIVGIVWIKSCNEVAKGKGLLLNEVSSRLHGKEHAELNKKGYPTNCIQRAHRC